MGAQNFNFACAFFYKIGVLNPIFCIVGRTFSTKKFLQPHSYGGQLSLCPAFQDATDEHGNIHRTLDAGLRRAVACKPHMQS